MSFRYEPHGEMANGHFIDDPRWDTGRQVESHRVVNWRPVLVVVAVAFLLIALIVAIIVIAS